jgi:hypothetical protein
MREVVDSPLIPEELQALYGQALDGLEGDFQLVTAQLRQPAIADHLLRADLTGVPRRLKQGLYDAGRAIADQPRRAARVAFKAANIILGSLSFVPGVEPIKEIKEAIEVGIDLTERHPQA